MATPPVVTLDDAVRCWVALMDHAPGQTAESLTAQRDLFDHWLDTVPPAQLADFFESNTIFLGGFAATRQRFARRAEDIDNMALREEIIVSIVKKCAARLRQCLASDVNLKMELEGQVASMKASNSHLGSRLEASEKAHAEQTARAEALADRVRDLEAESSTRYQQCVTAEANLQTLQQKQREEAAGTVSVGKQELELELEALSSTIGELRLANKDLVLRHNVLDSRCEHLAQDCETEKALRVDLTRTVDEAKLTASSESARADAMSKRLAELLDEQTKMFAEDRELGAHADKLTNEVAALKRREEDLQEAVEVARKETQVARQSNRDGNDELTRRVKELQTKLAEEAEAWSQERKQIELDRDAARQELRNLQEKLSNGEASPATHQPVEGRAGSGPRAVSVACDNAQLYLGTPLDPFLQLAFGRATATVRALMMEDEETRRLFAAPETVWSSVLNIEVQRGAATPRAVVTTDQFSDFLELRFAKGIGSILPCTYAFCVCSDTLDAALLLGTVARVQQTRETKLIFQHFFHAFHRLLFGSEGIVREWQEPSENDGYLRRLTSIEERLVDVAAGRSGFSKLIGGDPSQLCLSEDHTVMLAAARHLLIHHRILMLATVICEMLTVQRFERDTEIGLPDMGIPARQRYLHNTFSAARRLGTLQGMPLESVTFEKEKGWRLGTVPLPRFAESRTQEPTKEPLISGEAWQRVVMMGYRSRNRSSAECP